MGILIERKGKWYGTKFEAFDGGMGILIELRNGMFQHGSSLKGNVTWLQGDMEYGKGQKEQDIHRTGDLAQHELQHGRELLARSKSSSFDKHCTAQHCRLPNIPREERGDG